MLFEYYQQGTNIAILELQGALISRFRYTPVLHIRQVLFGAVDNSNNKLQWVCYVQSHCR